MYILKMRMLLEKKCFAFNCSRDKNILQKEEDIKIDKNRLDKTYSDRAIQGIPVRPVFMNI